MIRLLTIDPGFTTGWAAWDKVNSIPATGQLGSIFKDPIQIVGDLSKQFKNLLYLINPEKVLIEDQWFSEHSITSLVSAKRGDTKKLTWLTGAYIAECFQKEIEVEMILPVQWKGNMNDDAVRKRVERILGMHYQSSHIADAVGIGLNYKGKFIKIGEKNE